MVRGGLGGTHWHAGQGERGRGVGEDGQGLAERDPEGDTFGRVTTERGETPPEVGSRVGKDSQLGEAVTEGDILPEAEVETGMVIGSDALGAREEGVVVGLQ